MQAQKTRNPSKGLKALAAVKDKNSETGTHKVFKQFGQTLPIKISRIDLPEYQRFPFVHFSTWFQYLVKQDQLDKLVGVKGIPEMEVRLVDFWDRFFDSHPDHEIYERHLNGQMDVGRTIPVLHHGDEGRGYKKRQVMVVSTHGALGKGSRHDRFLDNPDHLPLNMLGNTYLTHFLMCLMPVAIYGDCPESFDKILQLAAEEYRDLFYNGIEVNRKKFWICCIGVKGDQPYVTKSGHFSRSFYRRPLKSHSKKPATGICHRCLAGKEDWVQEVPYEQFGDNCVWMDTIGLISPCEDDDPSPMFILPCSIGGGSPEQLWRFDLFHNWHSGAGKTFLSSSIVVYLSALVSGDSVEKKFQVLTEDFLKYCKSKRHTPYYKKLALPLFGITSLQDCPSGSWTKGEYTTLLGQWFEDSFPRFLDGFTEDPFLLKIAP